LPPRSARLTSIRPTSPAIIGNPLFLVKARMQAYSPFNPVGVQHAYKGTWDGLRSIVRADGVTGLWRGVDASMLRTAMGSSVRSLFGNRERLSPP